jgi:hypothetical protein
VLIKTPEDLAFYLALLQLRSKWKEIKVIVGDSTKDCICQFDTPRTITVQEDGETKGSIDFGKAIPIPWIEKLAIAKIDREVSFTAVKVSENLDKKPPVIRVSVEMTIKVSMAGVSKERKSSITLDLTCGMTEVGKVGRTGVEKDAPKK